MLTLFKRIIN